MDTATVGRPVRTRSRAMLRPRPRKVLLSVHVIASVGWLGADLCLLLLGIRALTSDDARTGQGAVLQMADIATWVTAPLAVLALLTGIVVSVTTPWGLFRHLWVTLSLGLTIVMTGLAVFVLVPLLRGYAHQVLAAPATARISDVLGPAPELVIPPSVAFAALSFITVINVLKPWGRIGKRAKRVAADD